MFILSAETTEELGDVACIKYAPPETRGFQINIDGCWFSFTAFGFVASLSLLPFLSHQQVIVDPRPTSQKVLVSHMVMPMTVNGWRPKVPLFRHPSPLWQLV